MAVPDPKNPYNYLSNMAAGKTSTGGVANAGQVSWAKSQLAKGSYVPDPAAKPAEVKHSGIATINPTPIPAPNNPSTTSTAAPSQAPSEYATWKTKQDELFSKLEGLANQEFKYDAATDPGYLAQRQLANLRADDANRATMETMNDRGLLQSTITNSQLDQNNQRAEQEALAYIPEYRQQAYGQHQDRLRTAGELLGYATDRGDTQYNRDYQQGRDAVGDAFNEAQLTGTYQSPEARAQIDALLELKRQAEAPGITAEQRSALSKQADGIRSKLSSMGVDISNIGANVNSANANAAAGVQTLASKQLERSNFESDRSFEFAKAQQEWQNIFNQAQFDESKAARVWEQAFQEKNFAQSVKDAAASRGLQWASLKQRDKEFIADQTFREKEFKYRQEQDLLNNRNKPNANLSAKESADNYSSILDDFSDGNPSKEEARSLLTQNSPYLTDSDYKKLNDWINDKL